MKRGEKDPMGKKRHKHPPKHSRNIAAAIRQVKQPKEFRIPVINHELAIEENKNNLQLIYEVIESINNKQIRGRAPQRQESDSEFEIFRLLAEVATGVWRSRQRMLTPGSQEPREEMRRAFRPLQATLDSLQQAGIQIVDRTNQRYFTGLAERVIATETSPGLVFETIIETIKPSIYYNGQLIQQGEVVIGIPDKGDGGMLSSNNIKEYYRGKHDQDHD
jgi:hypothetical protein